MQDAMNKGIDLLFLVGLSGDGMADPCLLTYLLK